MFEISLGRLFHSHLLCYILLTKYQLIALKINETPILNLRKIYDLFKILFCSFVFY